MNIEKMKHLKVVLEGVRDRGDRFDINIWHQYDRRCRTAACALGWAAEDPTFRRQGLNLIPIGYGGSVPTYTYVGGLAAGMLFFDLSEPETFWLFKAEAREQSIHEVIFRVQFLIKKHEAFAHLNDQIATKVPERPKVSVPEYEVAKVLEPA